MFTVNVVDYFMIITLIVGIDWLGLVRFARFIKAKVMARRENLKVKRKLDKKDSTKTLAPHMLQA